MCIRDSINPDAAKDPAFGSSRMSSSEPSEESARQSEELQQIRQALADLSITTLEGNAQSDRSRQELIAALAAALAAAERNGRDISTGLSEIADAVEAAA